MTRLSGKSQIQGSQSQENLTRMSLRKKLRSNGLGMLHAHYSGAMVYVKNSDQIFLAAFCMAYSLHSSLAQPLLEKSLTSQKNLKVSLAPNVTETLYALGAGKHLVAGPPTAPIKKIAEIPSIGHCTAIWRSWSHCNRIWHRHGFCQR